MLKGLVALLLLVNLALGAVLAGWLRGPNQDDAEREPARLQRQFQPEVLTLTPPGPVATPLGATPADPAAPAAAASASALAGSSASAPQASASGTVGGLAPGVAASAALNAVVLPAVLAAATGAGPAPTAASAAANPPAGIPPAATNATTAAVAVAEPGVCLQTSPLSAAQVARLETTLREAGWAPEAWRRTALPAATRYLLLMGPYPSSELLRRKQRELDRRKVAWTTLAPAPDLPAGLTPGLSLGRHDSEAAAEAALRRLNDRGVRSARVVTLPPVAGQALLRLDPVSPAQQAQLARLRLPANTSWQACN